MSTHYRQRIARYAVLLGLLLCSFAACANDDAQALWPRLREGGKIVLLRHALTPSQLGDPPGMTLDDCVTQRNLTQAGREQARRIGAAFAQQRIKLAGVRSSRFCRCIDTAREAFGQAEVWDALNGVLHDSPDQRKQKAVSLQSALATAPQPGDGVAILVTHNFNIKDATGAMIAMGAALVIEPKEGSFEILGTLPPP